MSIHQLMFANYGHPLIVVDGGDFDGTNDYMTRGAGLTDAADSKQFTFAAWVRLDGGDGAAGTLLSSTTTVGGATTKLLILRAASNVFGAIANNSAGTQILSIGTTGTYTASATWLHVLMSFDLSDTAKRFIYINDVDDTTGSPTTYTDDTMDMTAADWGSGGFPSGGNKLNGCLAEVWFTPGLYLDLSNVYWRRKFISASGKPVHLGTTGALPTGTAPLIYHHLDDAEAVANFATNRGTGGDFAITGTLVTADSSPSD